MEFVDDFEPVENSAQSGGVVVGGETIDDEIVRKVSLAADGKALARYRGRFGEQLVAGGVGGRDAGDQEREVQEIPSVEGQVSDFSLRYGACDLCAGFVQYLRIAGDHDIGIQRGNRELDVEIKGGANGGC